MKSPSKSGNLGEIRAECLGNLKEYYEALKQKSRDYGELKEKICIATMQEKWNDQAYGCFVEDRLIRFYEEDVRSLPINAQTADWREPVQTL